MASPSAGAVLRRLRLLCNLQRLGSPSLFFVCQILKKSDRDDIATLVSIVGLVIVLAVVVGMVGDLFTQIKDIFELT